MIIKKVNLKNIKSFKGSIEFDFSNSSNLNTISGINGSGKTTLFKSILLAQRAFFYSQLLNNEEIKNKLNQDLLNYFSDAGSEINISFQIDATSPSYPSFSIKCISKVQDTIEWKLACSDDDYNEIVNYWNIRDPKRIIVYIDSNRYINENNFTHENISIKSTYAGDDLALDSIFNPDGLFSSIYERIIKDYLRERVIPNKSRKDIPHLTSKILIQELLDYIHISNFSGFVRENQFILQIKSQRGINNKPYDLRNMSSGEKTIFYIMHFICYVRNIGMLIIDEPENNLHENLLTEFIQSLSKICESENFGDLIKQIARKEKVLIRDKQFAQIRVYYSSHELSQVFLLTHSKTLIYNNLSLGTNYYVDNGLKVLEYDEIESILRSIGLSKIYNKVLFVEGKTDNSILEAILSPHNIKVKSLGSCGEVISTYKNYLKLKQHIKDVLFCFMIDLDTRGEQDIEAIKDQDPKSFGNHFIILDRHEIENYFLEPSLYVALYNNHQNSFFPELTTPDVNQIESDIKAIADKHKQVVIKKTLQNLNQKSFGKLKTLVSGKALPISTIKDYQEHIDNAFTNDSLEPLINSLKKNYKAAKDELKDWDTEWIKKCDGKIVFNEYTGTLEKKIGIFKARIQKQVINIALNSNKYIASKQIQIILSRFN